MIGVTGGCCFAAAEFNDPCGGRFFGGIVGLKPATKSTLLRMFLPESLPAPFPDSFPRSPIAESRPQLHKERANHCQRLPSRLLVENAPEQFIAPSATCPEAFPIKANNYSATCLDLIFR
jgi:hypothetical protein